MTLRRDGTPSIDAAETPPRSAAFARAQQHPPLPTPQTTNNSDAPASKHTSNTIAALTPRITRGDDDAFATFYDAWFDRAVAITRRITRRDESTCLDIVQHTMLKAARSIPPLATDGDVARWMTRTLHHAAIDRFRSEARAARRERRAHDSNAPTNDPHAPHERDEQIAWLRAQLDSIPPPDRIALLARFGGSRTLASIGTMLGSTGAAAHGRIRRTLERLRSQAREHFDE